MEFFWTSYLASEADATNPLAAPLRATDFRGLPPAHIITCEFDPLRDEGEAYARRLKEAGVPVTMRRYDGMFHGCLQMAGLLDVSKTMIEDLAEALRRGLHG